MTGFQAREDTFEAKFAHDQELRFRLIARRNKRLGLWAANLMSLSGDEAEQYAKDVIRSDFEEAGDDDVLRKVAADLAVHDTNIDEATVRSEMDRLLAEVADEASSEKPD